METPTILTLGDVKHTPKVMKLLPSPLRNGDQLHLQFTVRKKTGPRTEELVVNGTFRVTQVSFDTTRGPQPRQLLTVEAVGVSPVWKAVKTLPSWQRKLPPARAPRTIIG